MPPVRTEPHLPVRCPATRLTGKIIMLKESALSIPPKLQTNNYREIKVRDILVGGRPSAGLPQRPCSRIRRFSQLAPVGLRWRCSA
jgi:hypothetical protein